VVVHRIPVRRQCLLVQGMARVPGPELGAAMSDTEPISPALQQMIDKSEMITAESAAADARPAD